MDMLRLVNMPGLGQAIRQLLALHHALTEKEKQEVVHFVDHDEYGLALQTWADIIREEGRELPEDLKASATLLALQMEIDPGALFDGTNRRL